MHKVPFENALKFLILDLWVPPYVLGEKIEKFFISKFMKKYQNYLFST
jgi:hypothetical protein